MRQKKEKAQLVTDRQKGIRNIRQIESLPVRELTDDEICKLFLQRFEAKALVMIYADQEGNYHSFGRLYSGKEIFTRYRRCVRYCWNLIYMLTHNIRQFPEPEDFNTDEQTDEVFDRMASFDTHGQYNRV